MRAASLLGGGSGSGSVRVGTNGGWDAARQASRGARDRERTTPGRAEQGSANCATSDGSEALVGPMGSLYVGPVGSRYVGSDSPDLEDAFGTGAT